MRKLPFSIWIVVEFATRLASLFGAINCHSANANFTNELPKESLLQQATLPHRHSVGCITDEDGHREDTHTIFQRGLADQMGSTQTRKQPSVRKMETFEAPAQKYSV